MRAPLLLTALVAVAAASEPQTVDRREASGTLVVRYCMS